MPLISIIVPVYNSSTTLCKCVDSVLSQDFRDFELLLIDDGSNDNSPVIIDIDDSGETNTDTGTKTETGTDTDTGTSSFFILSISTI